MVIATSSSRFLRYRYFDRFPNNPNRSRKEISETSPVASAVVREVCSRVAFHSSNFHSLIATPARRELLASIDPSANSVSLRYLRPACRDMPHNIGQIAWRLPGQHSGSSQAVRTYTRRPMLSRGASTAALQYTRVCPTACHQFVNADLSSQAA